MSLSNISSYFQTHLSILEKYLLSNDKKKFISTLTSQNDKKIINLLINPLPQNYLEVLKQQKIPSHVLSELLNAKLMTTIRTSEQGQNKSKAIERYTNEYYKSINFDFPKPVQTTNFAVDLGTDKKSQELNQNSKLALPESLAKHLQELVVKDWRNFQAFTEFGIKQLSEQYLLNLHIENKQWLINRADFLVNFSDKFVIKLLISFAEPLAVMKNVPFFSIISTQTVQSLTKSQINLLKSQKPEMMNNTIFARRWFELNYLEQIQEEQTFFKKRKNSITQLDLRRKTLVSIRQDLRKVSSNLLKPYENHLFYEILVLDLKRQDPDKVLFYEFLQNVDGVSSFFNKQFRQTLKTKYGSKSLINYSAIRSSSLLSTNYNIDKLIVNYIRKLFKKYKNTQELKTELNKYLDFNIVNSEYARTKLEDGDEVPNLSDILSKNEIDELKKSKQITIVTEKTQKFFKAQDDVVLTIRLKNIKQMKLKVYEMNMEQFYLENPDSNIDETINLQYLNPTYEEIIEIKSFKSPYQVIEQELLVDKIQKACGFYIVELVGEGITSRAVIRKGAIACFEESHIDGKLLKFYDESGHPIENIKIWVNGRSQILSNAEHIIPFTKNSSYLNVLAVRDSYAEKFSIYLQQEVYSFDVGLIYNHESFIVGKKSKIILHPVLNLGSNKISLGNMQNIKVTANLVNNQNIKSSQKFQNVKFSDEKDYILEIPIKSYTRSIDILVQGQVKDLQGKVQNLSYNKTISIQLMQGATNIIDMYLKRTNQGKNNTLKVLGLNGQVMANLQVNLLLTTYGTYHQITKVLKTNSKGEIILGNLQFVALIKASVNTTLQRITRIWNLSDNAEQVSFCDKQLTYHQKDEVNIPLPFNWNLNQKNIHQFIAFSKRNDEKIYNSVQNHISSIKIAHKNQTNYLQFSKLSAGVYDLKFLKIGNNVQLRILQGIKWPNRAVFSEKHGLVHTINQSPSLFVSLGDLKQQKGQKQNTKTLKIPINIPQQVKDAVQTETMRVHIILKNDFDSYDSDMNESFNLQNHNVQINNNIQSLSYHQSNFYSNKTLSDQQSYVLNRQNQKQFIGNNLEKPRIFLKRIQVRDTTETDELLSKEGGYTANDDYGRCGGGGGVEKCFASKCPPMRDYMARQLVQIEYKLNSHNNFFSLSGHCLLNSKYRQNLQFTIPSGYSQVTVYLITNNSAIRKNFYLEDQNSQLKKDLKHAGLTQKQQNKGWSMSRQIYQLQKGEKRQISRDSLWCTVSLSNILQFAQIKGHKLPLWISQWKLYSQTKKLEVYDKQICHQLNVFIKHHDSQFFNTIVEPFIGNKISKTFVDMCLLGAKTVLQYAAPHRIQTLNEFEKMLLIESLVANGLKAEASQIAASMDLYQKSIKRGFEAYKELFDIILNSQAASSKLQPSLFQPSMMIPQYNSSQSALFGFNPPTTSCYADAGFTSQAVNRMQQQCDMFAQCQMQQAKCEKKQRSRKPMSFMKRNSDARIFKPGFKQVEKTKEYTQTTYAGMKYPKQSTNLIQKNLFWAHLATYLASGDSAKQFLSEAFLYFTQPIEFTLACCFLSSQPNADYELNNQGDNFVIEANNSFMLFVKEVKQLDYADKFGVLINQRFFNPQERYTYEDDGTQIEKLVDEFLVKKPYTLQTVVTNTSGTNLQLQLLMDIPSGAIPLMSHEYVQIINANVNSFSTTSFERHFYFPAEGAYNLYPANASRNNIVIAKAKKLPQLQVKLSPTVNKLESFSDVMRSGSKKEILEYIDKRNIFDSKIFTSYSILWMLKDKDFFNEVTKILRRRNFYDNNVWSFGIYHKDSQCILEYIEANKQNSLRTADIPIFEYFPYFSRRTHKFLDDSKSTIRNVQFRQTYKNFVINSLLEGQYSSAEKTAFAYYLLLQDRIDECAVVFKSLSEEERKSHKIQTDYLACYLSMYQDYPNFTTAQTISQQYQNYPITTWNKMFKQIFDTLKEYQEDVDLQEQTLKRPATQFRTTFVNESESIKVNVPTSTRVEVYFYDINLELYFSDYPFDQVSSLSIIKPKESKIFASGESRQEKIAFSQVQHLGNMIVEIYEFKEGVPALKIGSFFWANPKVKVKISQNEGTLQVFYQGKKQTGCYVKVYSTGTKGNKFYRDGYTDITGKFKYALADLQGLTKFSILTITKQGGIINQVSPPSTAGYF